ncbi:hypothetical protein D3C84_723270 [compost metagenome]
MNQTISQSRAILQGVRLQPYQGTAKMYQRIGRDEPVRIVDYTLAPRGGITVEVIKYSTGTAKGEPANHKTVKAFARTLLRWTIGSALLLILFAYFGAGH